MASDGRRLAWWPGWWGWNSWRPAPTSHAPTSHAPTGDATAVRSPRVDSLALGVTWLLVLSVAQRGIGLGRNVLICRYLDPVELGKWNILFQFLVMAPPLLVLGIPGTFGRYVEAYRLRGQLADFLRRTLIVTAGCSLVGLILMLICRRQVAVFLFDDPAESATVVWASLVAATVVVYNLLTQLLAALRLPRALSIVNFVNTIVFTGATVIWLAGTSWGAMGVTVSYGVGSVAAAAMALWVTAQWWSESAPESSGQSDPIWQKLVPLALWIWTSDFCFNLFAVVDRYMIVHMSHGDANHALGLVGQFHSSHVLGLLLISLGDMLSNVALPYLTHDWEQGRRPAVTARLNRGLQLVAILLTGCAAGLIVTAPWVFDHVLQGKYTEGRDLMPITMAFCIWYAMALQMKNYLWVCERGYWITASLVVGIVVNVVLNLWWLPAYGLWGAVAATTLANVLVLAAIAGWSHRYGWRGDLATWLAMVLPATLLIHSVLALIATVAFVGWGIHSGSWGMTFGQLWQRVANRRASGNRSPAMGPR